MDQPEELAGSSNGHDDESVKLENLKSSQKLLIKPSMKKHPIKGLINIDFEEPEWQKWVMNECGIVNKQFTIK